MLKYYNEIMNPKKKQKKPDANQQQEQFGSPILGTHPNAPPGTTAVQKKKPWEIRHEKMEKTYNPELEKAGLPTSFGQKKGRKRKADEDQ